MNPEPSPSIPPSMAPPSQTPPPDPQPQSLQDVPQPLAAELRSLAGLGAVPAHIDAAVLAHARRSATRRQWQRRVLLAAPLAAAAGLALVVWVASPSQRGSDPRMSPPAVSSRSAVPRSLASDTIAAHGDINADGAVDMRDALALAQRIQRSRPGAGDDQNRDGVVDARDVDTLALLAVRLPAPKGGGA